MNRTTFRDLLMLLLLGFVFIIVSMLPHMNPPAQKDMSDPPGNMIVHILWPPGDTDVDLWVTGPGEPVPVGYSNKSGVLWNLLRDDLGTKPDATPLNYENAYTRGIVPGQYQINVHCYNCPVTPVPVDVEVSLKSATGGKAPMKILVTTRVTIYQNWQELTAIRFSLGSGGKIVEGSMNHVFSPLRAMHVLPDEYFGPGTRQRGD